MRLIVQLMDGFGTVEAEKPTDNEGNVDFNTITGIHRLRVIGRDIEEFTTTLDIENVETTRVENLRITLKRSGSEADVIVRDNGGMVNVTGLNVPKKAQRHFKQASEAMQKQKWEQAKREFSAAIDIYPKYDLAYNGMGVAEYLSGDIANARVAFEKAIRLNDRFAGAYRNLARICLAEHNWVCSDELLTKSLTNEPLNVWALTNAAYAQLQEKHFDDAIVNARRVHGLAHEGFENAHFIAALALEAQKRPNEALAEYELYLKEAPDGPNAIRSKESAERIKAAITPMK